MIYQYYVYSCEKRGDTNMERYITCMIILPYDYLVLVGALKYKYIK